MARMVEVVPYDPLWPTSYAEEAAKVVGVLGRNLISIHHVGSTAIPEIAAKPTIDMLAVVRELALVDNANTAMWDLGYQPKGEHGIIDRRYFRKLEGENHLFHLHAFKIGHPEIERHLNFRDYLRAHPVYAQAYQKLKLRLAEQFTDQPRSYTSAKTDFILSVDQQAALWREEILESPEPELNIEGDCCD